jgi:hypothetical protein
MAMFRARVRLRCISVCAVLLGVSAVLPQIVRAQASGAAKPTSRPGVDSVSAMLLAMEDQWAAGVVKRDGALFERMLAPGMVYTEDQTLMTRSEVIASVTTGTDTVRAARNDGMVVHRYGDVTAVVTGWLSLMGRSPIGKFDRKYRFTDTWTKLAGRWQIVAAQDYLVPSSAKR